MAIVQQAPPIARGYPYAVGLDVASDDEPFPSGCALRAEVRDYAGAATLAGTLSTEDGSIVLVDEHNIELHIPPTITANLGNSTATIDFARTIAGVEQWIGVQVIIAVVGTATAP